VPEVEALALRDAIHSRLPGYLVPRLVREIPGQPGKTAA
jgi:L-lysine 2,3-aminomutase